MQWCRRQGKVLWGHEASLELFPLLVFIDWVLVNFGARVANFCVNQFGASLGVMMVYLVVFELTMV